MNRIAQILMLAALAALTACNADPVNSPQGTPPAPAPIVDDDPFGGPEPAAIDAKSDDPGNPFSGGDPFSDEANPFAPDPSVEESDSAKKEPADDPEIGDASENAEGKSTDNKGADSTPASSPLLQAFRNALTKGVNNAAAEADDSEEP